MADDFFLSRWSRRKALARRGEAQAEPRPQETAAPLPPAPIGANAAAALPGGAVPAAPPPLPPLESLTPESDFTPFMRPEVDPHLRGQALRTLFQDPRFNVMDGLDVYIDDYSKPDPIPTEWMGRLRQMARLGDYREPDPEASAEEEPSVPPSDAQAPASPEGTAQASDTPPESDTGDAGDGRTEVHDSSGFTRGR